MITAYAILATFFLGVFVRHNLTELLERYRALKLRRKVRRDIEALQKTVETKLKRPQAPTVL